MYSHPKGAHRQCRGTKIPIPAHHHSSRKRENDNNCYSLPFPPVSFEPRPLLPHTLPSGGIAPTPTTTFFPKTKSSQMSIRYRWVKSTDLPFPTIFLQMARKFPTQYILHWTPCSVRLYIHPTCLIFFEGLLLLTYWGFSSSPA